MSSVSSLARTALSLGLPTGVLDRSLLVDCEGADWIVFEQLDLQRYRPGMIKVEVGALPAPEIGRVVVKLKTAGYQVGFQAEDIWAFA